MNDSVTAGTHVLTLDAVKWSIGVLKSNPVHPFFLAYLQLWKRSIEDPEGWQGRPRWADLRPLLEVPGGPPKKPNYRPLRESLSSNEGHYWMNDNLSGSYSPSSVRETAEFLLNDKRFQLPDGHAELALQAFLMGQRVLTVAMGGYFLRNFGFQSEEVLSGHDIVAGFRQWFRLEGNDDFDLLFDGSVPDVSFQWFETLDTEMEKADE